MSGVYIHVPFCAKKCDYCDFYSVVNSDFKARYTKTINKEIELRKDYLNQEELVDTIYFGGGTPSMLEAMEIEKILNALKQNFSISPNPEITLEANPDDLSLIYLQNLRSLGVNRLSIGIQSFNDDDLTKLGRRHNAEQAIRSVEQAKEAGFENISIDLIYGLPYSSSRIWEQNLKTAFNLPVIHLSCYHLIYEQGTPLQSKVARGLVSPVSEESSVEQFEILQQLAQEHGFTHYEISNLAKEGFYSRHNTSYWKQVPYLGLGPSAHSYNRFTRDWNPKSIKQWTISINNGETPLEQEKLTETDKYNDYVLTSLRTIWGADLEYIAKTFGDKKLKDVLETTKKYIEQGVMVNDRGVIKIHPKDFLISDGIISDFFEVD